MARILVLLALGGLLAFGCTDATDHTDDADSSSDTIDSDVDGDDHTHGDDDIDGDSHEGDDQDDDETSSLNDGAPTDLVVYRNLAGEIEDPVFGILTTPETAVAYQDYKGMRYYFSCIGCKLKFAANPEKYATK